MRADRAIRRLNRASNEDLKHAVYVLTPEQRHRLKEFLAGEGTAHYYGDGGTIHRSGVLDVEIDAQGNVVAVWFRCRTLPWRLFKRDDGWGGENPNLTITGVEFKTKDAKDVDDR